MRTIEENKQKYSLPSKLIEAAPQNKRRLSQITERNIETSESQNNYNNLMLADNLKARA